MNIISIKEITKTFHIVETDSKTFPTFRRTQDGGWYRIFANEIEDWNNELETTFQAFIKAKPLIEKTESEKIRILDERRLAELEVLLDLIPECPIHGRCIPYAKEWISGMKTKNDANVNNTSKSIVSNDNQIFLVEKTDVQYIVHTAQGTFRKYQDKWEKYYDVGFVEIPAGSHLSNEVDGLFQQYLSSHREKE